MKKATNSCYLDTNILIYYQDSKSPFYRQVQKIVNKLVKGGFDLVISPLVLDEYFYNTFASSNKDKREKIKMIELSLREILQLPKIKIVNPPLKADKQLKVLKFMEKFNLQPRDAYHLLTALENQVKYLASFDNDFVSVFKKKLITKFNF